jgi:hypothetical protein
MTYKWPGGNIIAFLQNLKPQGFDSRTGGLNRLRKRSVRNHSYAGSSVSEMDIRDSGQPTQDDVLGNFQPSLRDSIGRG